MLMLLLATATVVPKARPQSSVAAEAKRPAKHLV
jgi:hypothetical protein